jgi:molecular chaperone GrpE
MTEETVELEKGKKKAQAENEKKDKKVDIEETATESNDTESGDQPEVKLEEVKEDATDFEQKYYYLAAEMDNLRKRMQREKEQTIKYGSESVLRDIIGVMDTFELTSNALKLDQDEKIKNIVVGLDMVQRQFVEALQGHGLSVIETEGKEFDPNFHEAIGKETSDKHKENQIIKEQQKGYLLNGRLLRASKVIVADKK